MFRKSLKHIADPLAKALLRTVSIKDPWEKYEHDVPTALYGLGARHDFSWYLEGESGLRFSSIKEVLAWLSTCSYASDPEIFHERDYWQHPCTFERLRTGDCEDFAIWAWRKLIELGYQAEFVAGRIRALVDDESDDPWSAGHAWVQYEEHGDILLLDAVDCSRDVSIRPLDLVRDTYLPEVSVDGSLRRFVYGGYYLLQQGLAD